MVQHAAMPGTFIIQSHRGAGDLAPENSLEAFELAWQMGTWPECDLRTTRDGVIVTHHDAALGSGQTIPELAWRQLEAISSAARFEDVLERMRGTPERRLYMDVKDVDLDQLAAMVRGHKVEPQVILASTIYETLRCWTQLLPGSQTLLWMGGDELSLRRRIDEVQAENFAAITQLQVHVHRVDKDFATFTPSAPFIARLAELLRSKGIVFQALPYGTASAEFYEKLLDLGVESFATDQPQTTLDVVRRYWAGGATADVADTRELLMERGAIAQAPQVFARQFSPAQRPFIVADDRTYAAAGRAVVDAFTRGGQAMLDPLIFDDPKLYAESRYVEQLESHLRQLGADAIPIAVGAGTINDLTKLAAHRTGRSYMVVATAASMDGYTAFGASITHQGSKQTFECPAPRAVLADLDVIAAAPLSLNAAGYADLLAKVTAGADWILADALGEEPIDTRAWRIVQRPLRLWIQNPRGVVQHDHASLRRLTEGLMMCGFGMQAARSSRPASGAEHQFSHLWDMQHHAHDGQTPPHGFKVGIATLAIARLYERLLAMPLEQLNVDAVVAQWPDWPTEATRIRELFEIPELREKALEETQAKHLMPPQLRLELQRLTQIWPELRERLRDALSPADDLRQLLSDAGAPTDPEQIGITPSRLWASFRQAYHIRRRFTVLDLVVRAGVLDRLLN